MEACLGVLEQAPAEPDEEAGEGLALNEPGASMGKGFQSERVGSIEETGQEEPTQPGEAVSRVHFGHGGGEGHRLAARGFDAHGELGSGGELTFEAPDEGVPGRVVAGCGERGPHLAGCVVEVDRGRDGGHVCHLILLSRIRRKPTMPETANNASRGWPGSRYRPARPRAIALRAAGGRGLVFDEVK